MLLRSRVLSDMSVSIGWEVGCGVPLQWSGVGVPLLLVWPKSSSLSILWAQFLGQCSCLGHFGFFFWINSGELSRSPWVLLLNTEGAGWYASGLSKGIRVLFSESLDILCRFFLLGMSPALNMSISLHVNFCVDDGHIRKSLQFTMLSSHNSLCDSE